MKISKEEAARRLNSSKNLLSQLGVVINPVNQPEVEIQTEPNPVIVIRPEPRAQRLTSTEFRAIVGVAARVDGVRSAAKEFGVTPSQARTAANSRDQEVSTRVSAATSRIQEQALESLMNVLGLITPDKLENTSAKDLAMVATNLSRVVVNTRPREESAAASNPVQLIVFAPPQRTIKSYDIIDVS